jgi:[DsrC]-trisulfide reductase subunit J
MYNAGKILIGIVIFLALITSPFWYNFGKASTPPKLDVGTKEKQCVESKAFMQANHMELLSQWRDEVLRDGKRIYVNSSGKEFNMSLQNTCSKCHSSKTKFCDRCHNYLNVAPNCWDCHIAPKEQEQQAGRSVN